MRGGGLPRHRLGAFRQGNPVRRQRVDVDAAAMQFGGQAERVAVERGLGCAVDGQRMDQLGRPRIGNRRLVRGLAADIDHPAPAACPHARQGLLDQVDRRLEVQFEHGAPRRQVDLARRSIGADAGGVVDQDVHRAEFGRRARHQSAARRLVRQVGDQDHGAAAQRRDALAGFVQALLRAGTGCQRYGRSVRGEPQRDGTADAAAGAGNQGDTSLQSVERHHEAWGFSARKVSTSTSR